MWDELIFTRYVPKSSYAMIPLVTLASCILMTQQNDMTENKKCHRQAAVQREKLNKGGKC